MVPAKLSLLLAACYCWGRVKAQPAAVHVSFFYTGFPLTVVPVDQFVPNANGEFPTKGTVSSEIP